MEYVLEAVVTLANPSSNTSSPSNNTTEQDLDQTDEYYLKLDERGLLEPTKQHLVTRIVFPFTPEPLPGLGVEHGHWRDTIGFADDPLMKLVGAILVREDVTNVRYFLCAIFSISSSFSLFHSILQSVLSFQPPFSLSLFLSSTRKES